MEGTMDETQNSGSILPGLQRIAELAREHPEWAFTNLAQVINPELLKEAFERTRKNGAVGVDGQTAEEYERELEVNLKSLIDRLHTGSYRAPAVRRVYIPKADGKQTRPIGIPTFEDKVLQRAVAMVLEAIYEVDFSENSYGFRPGRSPHQALEAIWKETMGVNGGWIVEADIQSFFDELDHSQLRSFLDRRVKDGVIRRAIDKWLKAGVMEEGRTWYPEAGAPQGGVISPLLANIYLHEVLDVWFDRIVKPRLQGRGYLIRYADDFVMVFSVEKDAQKVMEALPKRFGRYGLRLHPEKTRMIAFNHPPRIKDGDQHPPGGGTFDFLGFTHYWGKTRNGGWTVKRQTAQKRYNRALKTIREWCRTNRHQPLVDQWCALGRKMEGHFNYYGITGNFQKLATYYNEVELIWRKWLSRRSQRGKVTWEQFQRLQKLYSLPLPRIVHSIHRVSAKSVV
jgi:RNA-directed DNA polymerase